MSENQVERIMLRIDTKLYKKIEKIAEENCVSIADVIRMGANHLVEEYEKGTLVIVKK